MTSAAYFSAEGDWGGVKVKGEWFISTPCSVGKHGRLPALVPQCPTKDRYPGKASSGSKLG